MSLGFLILKHTDNLSRVLQKEDISAAEGKTIADMTVSTLKSLCSDSCFDLFWQKTTASAEAEHVNPPSLGPSTCKLSLHYIIIITSSDDKLAR